MKTVFNVLTGKGNVESAKNFSMNNLMKNVKIQETKTHLYISNFPGAFGDTQNKNNRVYDWDSLVFAVNWFNSIKDENPYFCYMFDGHKDDDSYENIVGRVVKLHLRPEIKCVMIDMKINKGSKSWSTIKNIMADGDPLGASMRILSPNAVTASKEDLYNINPDIVFLNDDDANIAYLMSRDSEIEYISGDSFIQRFDLTQFPSFNDSFVAKQFDFDPQFNKNESAVNFRIPKIDTVKLAGYKEASVSFQSIDKCITNSCKFRHTVKDFVDLINMDESIKLIKDNPDLYNDMIKFSYLNLDAFDFDKIIDSDYLSSALVESNIGPDSLDQWKTFVTKITGEENVVKYIIESNEIQAVKLNVLLNSTINALVDEDNIFYQIVTINYLHWLILSAIILTGKTGAMVSKQEQVKSKLESNLTAHADDNNIAIDMIKNLNKQLTVYDYINSMFTYIYKYVDKYSDKTAPLTIINESLKVFRPVKSEGVVNNKFIKMK